MTTQQIIGENLTELRERQGLTRGDIAKGVSVTNQTVAAWEWGDALSLGRLTHENL